ncbi:MAG TPA: NADH-quinone oxidoreductase subunit NuoH [Verrucomicrobiae bacterium]|jgi:NADH-quinone oxidoreductase subunit H|nr:NADH-quinone oxidoreductase subunit NuoH [Verrucomicrobiae bacterium]
MDWFLHSNPQTQFLLFSVIKVVCVFAVVMPMVAYAVLAERKISAFIQDRLGPNRLGPGGIWQPLADGVKSFLKEDFTPDHVRKTYFWLAPMVVMIPSLLTLAVIPFGSQLGHQKMVIADLDVGILYTFGIVSLGVYGIVLAGYASNSKYPFFGGIRSSAQMISYEISMGMSVVPVFLIVGELNLSQVITYQAEHGWLVMYAPLSFLIFMVAAFAETNRLPFDLPESEQELVGGYHTEYSSMKFALFFMGEYASMITASAMMVTLFLGGWTLPFAGLDKPAETILIGLAQIGIFLAKIGVLMGIFIWVRWMWPRFRYDQLMDLGWRRFIPVALANIVVTALWLWLKDL